MEVAMSEWWRRFKEANATERAYVIVLAVFFVLFIAGAFFFDHAVLAFLVPVLLVIAVILEHRIRTRKD